MQENNQINAKDVTDEQIRQAVSDQLPPAAVTEDTRNHIIQLLLDIRHQESTEKANIFFCELMGIINCLSTQAIIHMEQIIKLRAFAFSFSFGTAFGFTDELFISANDFLPKTVELNA